MSEFLKMELTSVGINSSGESIYTQFVIGFVRENNIAMQRCKISHGNPISEKPRWGKEFTIFKRLQWIMQR